MSAPTGLLAAPPARPASAWTASLAFAWRSLLKIKHVPEQLGDVIGIPILFTLLFTYLFGGAVSGSTHEYLQFLLPGTLALAVVFVTVYSGVTLNSDLSTGAFDRFRSMPIWRPAPIVGALIGDLGRYLLAAGLVVGLGFAMGYRAHGGVAGVAAAIALVIDVRIGAVVDVDRPRPAAAHADRRDEPRIRDPLPGHVPQQRVRRARDDAGWLRHVAEANPISHLVTTARGLMEGTASTHDVLVVLATSAAILAVFAPITGLLYQRRQ